MAYPTDLSGAQWELLEPVLGVGGARGPQPRTDRRVRVVEHGVADVREVA